jgi:hypothetical protein
MKTEKFYVPNIEAHLEIPKENEITQVASTWTPSRKIWRFREWRNAFSWQP